MIFTCHAVLHMLCDGLLRYPHFLRILNFLPLWVRRVPLPCHSPCHVPLPCQAWRPPLSLQGLDGVTNDIVLLEGPLTTDGQSPAIRPKAAPIARAWPWCPHLCIHRRDQPRPVPSAPLLSPTLEP